MYMMWTSKLPDSIPVPISSQSWLFTNASAANAGFKTTQQWMEPPIPKPIGRDGDPVNYVRTAPSSSPYGYPTWDGPATPVKKSVCPTASSSYEYDEYSEEEQ